MFAEERVPAHNPRESPGLGEQFFLSFLDCSTISSTYRPPPRGTTGGRVSSLRLTSPFPLLGGEGSCAQSPNKPISLKVHRNLQQNRINVLYHIVIEDPHNSISVD